MMTRPRLGLVLLAGILFAGACAEQPPDLLENRWTYVSRSLREDSDVAEIQGIVETAAKAGLNGILLSGGFREARFEEPDYLRRLDEVREICDRNQMEIIPIFLSAGYGHGLDENPNLAAGLPVRDALFIVQGDEAQLRPDHEVILQNGDFEAATESGLTGFSSPETTGDVIHVDSSDVHSGKKALRFERFGEFPSEAGQLKQIVKLVPYRAYTLSAWFKTEGMDPPRPFSLGHIRLEVRGMPDGRRLQLLDPQIPTDTDWREFTVGFNSMKYEEVELSIGVATGEGGRFWIDDLKVEETGMASVLRRPGTPIKVQGEASGTTYEEGKDFARIEDPGLNHRLDHAGPPIRLIEGSLIKDGERLRVSWYHSLSLYRGQVSVCMSEPELFEIYRRVTELVDQHLSPGKFFLSMDEVRAGGSCAACKAQGVPMGEILGRCLTKQVELIRNVHPGAEVFTWSDMLDPTHNSGRKFYYLVDGDFDQSWNHVPKDLIMAIWGRRVRTKSFAHFSGLGFKTLGAAYYDTDDLEDIPGWLEVLKTTPGATGVMYTTWLNKYELLPEFGRLLKEE
ncbi:MAG: hypothetical protein JSU96_05650 [Acidobacteriota bacterium]|nr:MAG: hypothetical protein JSU96_05650 [Acidobacteriota bacterium]